MAEKKCTKCGEVKEAELFPKDKNRSDGLYPWCKRCNADHVAAYRTQKPDSFKQWYSKNAEQKRVKNAKWKEDNTQRVKEYAAAYSKKPEALAKASEYKKRVGYNQKRRALKLQALTNWDPEFDELVMQEAYAVSRLRTKLFGFAWHVDHIVPLAGKSVRGLHNAYNVQVIPAKHNLAKNNRVWPHKW